MFSIDGKFFRSLEKAGNFLILCFLWGVGCIPIVTIGASTTAAFSVAMKLIKDEEGYIFRGYWNSFKQNFKQAFIIELIVAAIAAILVIDLRAAYLWATNESSVPGMMFVYVVVGLLIVWGAWMIYLFSLLSRFSNTIPMTLKNSIVICMHHLPQTIIMVIATFGLIYFSLGMWPAFIITIPVIFYIDSFILTRIYKPFEEQSNESTSSEEE